MEYVRGCTPCLRLEILEFVRSGWSFAQQNIRKAVLLFLRALSKNNNNNNELNKSGNSITNSVQGTLLCGTVPFYRLIKYPRTETPKDQPR